MSVNEKMTAIADAIRDKTGETSLLTLDDMATDIPKVYETGKQAERDEFWDAYQENGKRTKYDFAFAGNGWGDKTFKPKYNIVASSGAQYLFHLAQVSSLKNIGVTISTTGAQNLSYAFYYSSLTECPEIDVSSALYCSGLFTGCSKLHTLDKLILNSAGSTPYSNDMFGHCANLRNITFGGVLGRNISFQWSPLLAVESIENIVSVLSDTENGQTITFNVAAKTTYYNAHSSEYADADEAWDALCDTKPNWTISLV